TSASPIVTAQAQNPSFKPVSHQAPSIAGDKRYSLATSHSERNDSRRIVSRPYVPNGLSTRAASLRVTSQSSNDSAAGLLVSVKLLPLPSGSGSTVRALESFSIEVFVHNRTNQVKRFRLSIPSREGSADKVREIWEKRRRKGNDEPDWGVNDTTLRQMLMHHLSSAPPLIPLEDDVRCGPLRPGASLSSRIRFLALRDGVFRLENLRITGLDNDFDFMMR
ncbi:MAG: hypothetical protein TREMPRED_004280, partial [Tremellales sp. Tagirdzhanova-0007]